MNELVSWLFDLDRIRPGQDAPLLLRWQGPLSAWLMLGLAVLGLVCIALCYQRERGSGKVRIFLATLRGCLLVLVGAVLCQPALVLQRNRVEPSYVALLLDTSQSMATREAYPEPQLARALSAGTGLTETSELARHSRLELAVRALELNEGAALNQLLERNGVQLYTFAGGVQVEHYAFDLESLTALRTRLRAVRPEGARTDLGAALGAVLDQAQGRHLAAIVLVSDGQATGTAELPDVVDIARGRQIPISALRLGSPLEPADVQLSPLRGQRQVFAQDLMVVEAPLTARGLIEDITLNITLVDDETEVVAAQTAATLTPAAPSAVVEFTTKPTRAGLIRYRVQVDPLPAETILHNNTEYLDINVFDKRLRVLYVEGYPRYEYRYLKNALMREETVELSVLLLEADPGFVQEGTDPIRRFPVTEEELEQYDVVLFGDVDPRAGWLSTVQMKMLLDFVGQRGGGFGLLAGERAAPHLFRGTPLEKLIPARLDPEFLGRYAHALTTGYSVRLTPEGSANTIFRLHPERERSEALFSALPELYWIARTLGPQPGATVLAEHPTLQTSYGTFGALPVVVLSRYGAGRVFFQATDDTWRWRRHTGALLHDTYWVRVVRSLARDSGLGADRRFVLRTERRRHEYGQPVPVRVEILDTQLSAEQGDTLSLTLTGSDGEIVARFEATRLAPGVDVFEGSFVPPRAGNFAVAATSLQAPNAGPATAVQIEMQPADLEARRPEANHELLERLARGTDGKIIELDTLQAEFAALRDRSVQIPDDVVEPLWDSKLVLTLFVLLISTEWALRKLWGLL